MNSIQVAGGNQLTSFSEMYNVCKQVCSTAFVPDDFRGKPEELMACWMTGMSYGWDLMRSLRSFHSIKGKATMAPEAMLSLIREHGHTVTFEYEGEPALACLATGVRRDTGQTVTERFSMADAKAAGITTTYSGKPGAWQKYPKNMMRWRAMSNLASNLFTDVIMGASYVPEELGAEVDSQGVPITADVPVITAGGMVTAEQLDQDLQALERQTEHTIQSTLDFKLKMMYELGVQLEEADVERTDVWKRMVCRHLWLYRDCEARVETDTDALREQLLDDMIFLVGNDPFPAENLFLAPEEEIQKEMAFVLAYKDKTEKEDAEVAPQSDSR